ncbi:hypothetical protein TSUD_79460 [Trifolium subterraneum]|uniref:Retrotransposon gag domain-containing protein n=1 Tax=Trifolium subterraneum TaxID=3900 RepID=A0A2Z6MAG9_TRISU|nr:hypothetical protein TSUD_79460 [Trifolium subterraneum]
MAALVNTINRQNELIREQNRRIQAVEDSRTASRVSRSTRRRRSPTPENNRSRSRSRSPRPAPRRNEERPVSPAREHPRRNNRSTPRRNNRSPPRNGEATVRGGNARPPPKRESPSSGDERHRGPLSRRIMDMPLPRASTWWRSLPQGSIDSWNELCRMFKAHFTTSRRHPKTVANLKAIIQGPEEPLRSYIERFNKVAVEVDATDKMKLYLLEDGLREGTQFQEAVGIVEMQTLDEFFELAQRYIKWEEKQMASKVRRPKNHEVGPSSQREEHRGEEKKRDCGKVREAKSPKSQFTHYTPLNAPRGQEIFLSIPQELRARHLAIEAPSPDRNTQEDNRVAGNVALAITRPEDFLPLPDNNEREALDYFAAHLDGSWENFPGALVISGGGFNPITIGSIKRKFDELEKASPVSEIKITMVKESFIPLAFYREEVLGGSPNFQIPLLVRVKMENFDVRRILVDQGSSCDIMYSGLFKVLQLTEENLVPYVGSDLQGFNGATTKPWGYVDLIVTRCFEAAAKNLNTVATPQKKKKEVKPLDVNSISTEDAVELDARTSKKERKQEKKTMKDDLLVKENYRHIPDGEFELIPLGEDPTKCVMIGVDLPDLVKRQLKACLRENAELFAWSAAEMPGIDPRSLVTKLTNVVRTEPDRPVGPATGHPSGPVRPEKRSAEEPVRNRKKPVNRPVHTLTIDPRASVVVQRRRKQSPEKAEAAKKAWPMCVDYTANQHGPMISARIYLHENLANHGVPITTNGQWTRASSTSCPARHERELQNLNVISLSTQPPSGAFGLKAKDKHRTPPHFGRL